MDLERLRVIVRKCAEERQKTDRMMENRSCDTKRRVDEFIAGIENKNKHYMTNRIGTFQFRIADTYITPTQNDICTSTESKFAQICIPQFIAEFKARGFIVESHYWYQEIRLAAFIVTVPL